MEYFMRHILFEFSWTVEFLTGIKSNRHDGRLNDGTLQNPHGVAAAESSSTPAAEDGGLPCAAPAATESSG